MRDVGRTECREFQNDKARARGRRRAQDRLPVDYGSLHAIYAGKPFREALRDLNLTPNQVWGLTQDRRSVVNFGG
jgi:hypothetical protein